LRLHSDALWLAITIAMSNIAFVDRMVCCIG